jgi:hypothetical protein
MLVDAGNFVLPRLARGYPGKLGVLGALEELFQDSYPVGALGMVGTGIVKAETGVDDETGPTHAALIPSVMYPRQLSVALAPLSG